ncbi:hypothetical protein D9M70_510080 [compost metagenome]
MIDQIPVHGESEHLAHQAKDHFGHPVYATGKQSVRHFGDVAFLHVIDRNGSEERQDILFKHAAHLIATVFTVDQVNFGPVVKQILHSLSGGLSSLRFF